MEIGRRWSRKEEGEEKGGEGREREREGGLFNQSFGGRKETGEGRQERAGEH